MAIFKDTAGDDYFVGAAGYDAFELANGGMDIAIGGPPVGSGDDTFDVQAHHNGQTLLIGYDGEDKFYLEDADDLVFGGADGDRIQKTGGVGALYGGLGDDSVRVFDGATTIYGDEGDDSLSFDAGRHEVYGGDGDDLIGVSAGPNFGYSWGEGGAGADTLSPSFVTHFEYHFAAGLLYAMGFVESWVGFENYRGGNGSHHVIGDAWDNDIQGHVSDDTLFGGGGADTLGGYWGDDQIFGGEGADYLNGHEGRDTLIDDGSTGDMLDGENGNDTAHAGDGDDLVIGGAGFDVLYGGDGDDQIWVASLGETSGEHFFEEDHIDPPQQRAYGEAGADLIYGADIQDLLFGGADGDEIRGGAGNDEIFGGDGRDWLYGDEGSDLIYAGRNVDLIFGGKGYDVIDAGAGDDTITGGDGIDVYLFEDGHGEDVIRDFQDGLDAIQIQGAAWADLTLTDYFLSLEISWSGGVIVLDHVDSSMISQADIMFV